MQPLGPTPSLCCQVSLLNGRKAELPLLARGEADLPDFICRALAGLADAGSTTPGGLCSLPVCLLVLSNNTKGSALFGEAITTTEELARHAEEALLQGEAGDGTVPLLHLSLTGRAPEEAACGVRRCRAGLTKQSTLHENGKGYHFQYPVAFIRMGHRMSPTHVSFPEFSGINVNMMPFRLGDITSLPEKLHGYWPLIQACEEEQPDEAEDGKIVYLTVDEQEIREGQATHRRGGLHAESPGVHLPGVEPTTSAPEVYHDEREELYDAYRRGELAEPPADPGPLLRHRAREGEAAEEAGGRTPRMYHARGVGSLNIRYHGWGIGMVVDSTIRGGIYMASNMDDTTEVFSAIVEDPRMIGHLGSCEHLRGFLGPGTKLKAGELCWFTDRTPHESLPLPAGSKRQFFRLVTSKVGIWFADHSTANPTGVVPDPRITCILRGSKFTGDLHKVSE